MAAPTLPRFLFPSARKSVSGEPLTFIAVVFARSFRWRFTFGPKPLFAESRTATG
jgi:hypothetical protein